MRYCIIENTTGNIVNIIDWDGGSEWHPPEGSTVRLWQDGETIHVPRFPADADLDRCRAHLRAEVADLRARLERDGLLHTFSDGEGVIQTRDDTDIRNIQGNTTAALVLKAQGVNDPVMTFRTADNVSHALTPDDAIAMGMAVAARVQALYSAKWVHDNAIALLSSIQDCETYDTLTGWPA